MNITDRVLGSPETVGLVVAALLKLALTTRSSFRQEPTVRPQNRDRISIIEDSSDPHSSLTSSSSEL